MNLDRVEKRFLILRHIVEIIAIGIGGGWILYTYHVKEAPSLEQSLEISNDVKILPYSPKECIISVSYGIKNIGKTSFEIDSTRYEVYGYNIDSISNGLVLNLDRFLYNHLPTYHKNYDQNDTTVVHQDMERLEKQLDRHYVPGATNKEIQYLKVPIQKNHFIISAFIVYPHVKDPQKKYYLVNYDFKPQVIPDKN